MLAYKIDHKAFKKLNKVVQDEYKKDDEANEESGYTLDVDGLEDTGALKRAKDHEAQKRKDADKKAKELQEKLDEVNEELTTLRDEKAKGGDAVSQAEKKLQEKHAKEVKKLQDEAAALSKALQEHAVENVARGLATELAGDNAELLIPHIQRRLVGGFKDGKVNTSVLDASGAESALTVEELKKEFSTSPKFSAVLVASKGSGAGGTGPRKGAGGAPGAKKLSEMTATEEAAFANQNPAEYQRMLAAESGAPAATPAQK